MYQLTLISTKGGNVLSWSMHEHVGDKLKEIWKSDSQKLEDVATEIGARSGAAEIKPERSLKVTAEIEARKKEHVDPNEAGLRDETDEDHDLAFLGPTGDAVDYLNGQLLDPRSGAYSYSVFRRFLDYECARYQTFAVPMSLVVFTLKSRDGGTLPALAATTAVLRLKLIKHKLDVIGVFEQDNIALILPNTRPDAASFVATKAVEILYSGPLAPGINKSTIKVLYKIVGFPDDGDDVRTLLAKIKKVAKATEDKELKKEA